MNYLFSLPHIRSVSKSFPVFQPRRLFELISSRYQLCLSHPAEQHRSLWCCVTWQLRKSPAALEDFIALVFCHVIEVLRHPEVQFMPGTPLTSLQGLASLFFCCVSSQCSWRRCGSTVINLVGGFKCGWVPLLPVLKMCPSKSTKIWSLVLICSYDSEIIVLS